MDRFGTAHHDQISGGFRGRARTDQFAGMLKSGVGRFRWTVGLANTKVSETVQTSAEIPNKIQLYGRIRCRVIKNHGFEYHAAMSHTDDESVSKGPLDHFEYLERDSGLIVDRGKVGIRPT